MKVAIVLNGKNLDTEIKEDFIIAADGGYRLLKNKTPDCVIGDFDSLKDIPEGLKIIKYPVMKNQTDGELCIEYAINQGYDSIVIYGALDGRIDHVMGNLSLLNMAYRLGVNAVIKEKFVQAFYTQDMINLSVNKGDIISLVPFGGIAVVKTSKNLKYPLNNLELLPHRTRGISNIAIEKNVTLEISQGGVIVFHLIPN